MFWRNFWKYREKGQKPFLCVCKPIGASVIVGFLLNSVLPLICLIVRLIGRIRHMTDFAYDGPIFLVPLSPSYPSSPVIQYDPIFTD